MIETLGAVVPPEVIVMLIAALPISELRGAIPVGILGYGLEPWVVVFFAILGNLIPVVLLLHLLQPVSEYARKRSKIINRALEWWFKKALKKIDAKYLRYGPLALLLFVAVPLPVTGAWTGATAAWLLKVKKKEAYIYIVLGICTAAGIVTALTQGIFTLYG